MPYSDPKSVSTHLTLYLLLQLPALVKPLSDTGKSLPCSHDINLIL